MAFVEKVEITKYNSSICNGKINWSQPEEKLNKYTVPMIFFSDGTPWVEANFFAISHAKRNPQSHQSKTLAVKMMHLHAYARFLEDKNLDWRYFPRMKSESVLFKFRQYLIGLRDAAVIAPSTAHTRMNAVVNFYRFSQTQDWVSNELWEDKIVKMKFVTSIGFLRTMSATTTDLSIPYRQRNSNDFVEEGLTPLSYGVNKEKPNDRAFWGEKEILLDAASRGNPHLYLMLQVSFITGARSETVRTINITQLYNASLGSDGFYRLNCGPGTGIKTKFQVNGQLQLPASLYNILCQYSESDIRAIRSNRASDVDKDYLFLTKSGKPYSKDSLNKLVQELRDKMVENGYPQFNNFHFHVCRATAITQRTDIAISVFGLNNATGIDDVRAFAFHKDEATTWKYFKYVSNRPKRITAGNKYVEEMFGIDRLTEIFEE